MSDNNALKRIFSQVFNYTKSILLPLPKPLDVSINCEESLTTFSSKIKIKEKSDIASPYTAHI